MSGITLTEKQQKILSAAFVATRKDGSINWDLLRVVGGYNTTKTAQNSLGTARNEIKALLAANGINLDENAAATPKGKRAKKEIKNEDNDGAETPAKKRKTQAAKTKPIKTETGDDDDEEFMMGD